MLANYHRVEITEFQGPKYESTSASGKGSMENRLYARREAEVTCFHSLLNLAKCLSSKGQVGLMLQRESFRKRLGYVEHPSRPSVRPGLTRTLNAEECTTLS